MPTPLPANTNLAFAIKNRNNMKAHGTVMRAVATGDYETVWSSLSDKQRLFVQEYMTDRDAKRSYTAAGYKSAKATSTQAYKLVRHPGIRFCIDYLTAERAKYSDVTSDYVIKKIHKIVEDADEANDRGAALRGLELLARHLGMFIERTEISGKDGEAIRMEKVKQNADELTGAIIGLAARARTGNVVEFPNSGTEG